MVKTTNIPAGMQAKVATCARTMGVRGASKALGLHEKTLLRVAAGIPSTAGTLAVVANALREMAENGGK